MNTLVSDQQSINVYPLVAAAELAQRANEIADVLFKMPSATDGQRRLTVSPASGCLSYVDRDRLWQNDSGAGLPSDATAAEAAARSFIEQAMQRAAARPPRGEQARLPELFPRTFRAINTRRVYAAGAPQPDHWLVQFMSFLAPGGILPTTAGVSPLPKIPELPQPHLDTAAAPKLPHA